MNQLWTQHSHLHRSPHDRVSLFFFFSRVTLRFLILASIPPFAEVRRQCQSWEWQPPGIGIEKKKSLASTARGSPIVEKRRFPRLPLDADLTPLTIRTEAKCRRCGPGCRAAIRISYSTRTPFIAAHNGRSRTYRGIRRGRGGRDRTQASNAVVMTEVDSRVSACVLWDTERALLSMSSMRTESTDALEPSPERGVPATPVALTRKRKYTSIFLLHSPSSFSLSLSLAELSISGHNSASPNIICEERLVRFRDTLSCRASGGRVYFAYWTIVRTSRTSLSHIAKHT